MSRYHLYKALEKAGYPMQGAGSYLISPDGNTTVYVPRPEEIYAQFIGDPSAWEKLTDTLAKAWIENKTGKPYLIPLASLKGRIIDEVVKHTKKLDKKLYSEKRPNRATKSRKKKS